MPQKKSQKNKDLLKKRPPAIETVVPVASASGGQSVSVEGGPLFEDATLGPLTSGQNGAFPSQSVQVSDGSAPTPGTHVSSQNDAFPSQSVQVSDGSVSTLGTHVSSQNDAFPSQSVQVSDGSVGYSDDWEIAEYSSISVPVQKLPKFMTKSSTENDKVEPNFTGTPVSVPTIQPTYLSPDLMKRIDMIFLTSGIGQVIDITKTNPLYNSAGESKDSRFNISTSLHDMIPVLCKSIGVPNIGVFQELRNGPNQSIFMKESSGERLTKQMMCPKLQDLISMFPTDQNISLEDLISARVYCSKNISGKTDVIDLDSLIEKLNPVEKNQRLKVFLQLFCSYIRTREANELSRHRVSDFTVDRVLIIPFLQQINEKSFANATSDFLINLAIELIKRSYEHSKKLPNPDESQYMNHQLVLYEFMMLKYFQPHLFSQSRVLESTLNNTETILKNGSSRWLMLHCDMLVVCAIFRTLNKSSSGKTLFWEIWKFVQETKIMEYILPLCFDTVKEYESVKTDCLFNDSKPAHLSSTTNASSKKIGLISVKECLENLRTQMKILDTTQTGGGKTTCWAMAHIWNAVLKSLQGILSGVVIIGPPNHASDSLIHVICHVLQEKVRGLGKLVKIVPVTGLVSPKMVSQGKSVENPVYVFVTDSTNSFPVVMSFFGENHQISVMIDDNQEFGTDINHGIEKIFDDKRVKNLTMCSASYNSSSIVQSNDVKILGSNTESLSYVSSFNMICHEIHLTLGQMRDLESLISLNKTFYENNSLLFSKIVEFLKDISISESDLSAMMSKLSDLYDTLLSSGLVNTLTHRKLGRSENESDNQFFIRLVQVVLKLVVGLFKDVSFKRNLIKDLIQRLDDFGNQDESGLTFMNFKQVTVDIYDFLDSYVKFHEDKIELPALPSEIIDMSFLRQLDKKYKEILTRLSSSEFVLPKELNFPMEVPILTSNEIENAVGSLTKSSTRLVVLGKSTDPMLFATDLANLSIQSYKAVAGISEKKCDDNSSRKPIFGSCDGKPNNDDGSRTSSDYGENIDMTSGSESDQVNTLLERFNSLRNRFSKNAPVPSDREIKCFVKSLVVMKSPLASLILRNFMLGVFFPTNEMPQEMIALAIKIFEEGRLCLIIQDGGWNFMSQNFTIVYQVYIFCFSEISFNFFQQNIYGRFGRVGQKGDAALVSCFTRSGKIVDDSVSLEESKGQVQMVSLKQLVSQSSSMSPVFLKTIADFINGFFTIHECEVRFVLELLRMINESLYDPRFKYACYGNDRTVFQLMSCYLISQLCSLGHCSSEQMKKSHQDFLKDIGINDKSLKNFKDLEETVVRDSFFNAVGSVMHCVNDLSTAISLLDALYQKKCPNLDKPLLVQVFFDIRKLGKFVELVISFLTNLYLSKTIEQQNHEVRAVITVFNEVKNTIDFLICLIASSVSEKHFLNQGCKINDEQIEGSVPQNKLENLHDNLSAVGTIREYYEILLAFSTSHPDYTNLFDKFKSAINSFGDSCLTRRVLDDLKAVQVSCQQKLTECDATIKSIQLSIDKMTGPPALKALKKLEFNKTIGEKLIEKESIERTLSDIPSKLAECEASLIQYAGMSEKDFLLKFFREIFN